MSNDEEPHYTSPPSPVVRNLKCVDAESYKTAEALLDDLLELAKERDEIRKQRDEARLQVERIFNEIDCRIEHGADSNGHLEAIRNLFKENTNA